VNESYREVGEKKRRLLAAGRLIATLALIIGVVAVVGKRSIGTKLLHLDLRFIVGFLLLSLPLYLLQTWRWCFTAARIGAPIRFRRAYFEYYLSTLLNQVLPFGVAGDVLRAARQVGFRRSGDGPNRQNRLWGPAARAVVLERFSGFMGLSFFVAVSLLIWFLRHHALVELGALGMLLVLVWLVLVFVWRASERPWLLGFIADGKKALLEHGALAIQLVLSTAIVAILIAMFACAARATGFSIGAMTLLQVVPLVFASTTLPWAFAGWGAREASTAALYALAGLDSSAGVAVSIAFGVLSLVAALPGVVVLALPECFER
jgi:uncharacterized membrane protein YbhN (UPF0104 family)